MKITDRDKKLLMVLAFFIVGFGFYKFVLINALDKITTLKDERQQLQEKISSSPMYDALISRKEKDIKIIKALIADKTFSFFPRIDGERVIVDLDDMLAKAKVNAPMLGFSDSDAKDISVTSQEKIVKDTPLSDVVKQYKNINQVEKTIKQQNNTIITNNQSTVNCYSMAVNISFNSGYSNILSFIKNVEKYQKRVKISNIAMSQSEKNEITGSMTLNLYGVPKISNQDKEFLKWDIKNVYGKDNPFDTVFNTAKAANKAIIKKSPKTASDVYDFFMSARSINSDLPSIVLGTANDKARKTYLYADNNKNENIFINVTQKEGKYYYSYSAGGRIYPEGGEGNVFYPLSDAVRMMIYSNPRSSEKDTAGANISINNKTDKKFIITVQYDDMNKPRINVLGESPNVVVVRK